MQRVPLIALLLLTACAVTHRPWNVQGGTADEQRVALELAEAAKRATPDRQDYLAYGGTILIVPVAEADARCGGPGSAGCGWPGEIVVLWPHPRLPGAGFERSALAHELCHLGLARGINWWGTVYEVPEAQADACALLVVQEWRRGAP